MNTSELTECLARELILWALISPLIFLGMRSPSQPNRWKLIGLSVLVTFLTSLATILPWIFEFKQPCGLQWNWTGKLACIAVIAVFASVLPAETLRNSGILSLPNHHSKWPVFGFVLYCGILGGLHAFASSLSVDRETLAFQLLMPSLAEEPIYRGILPGLLAAALGSPWRIGGARLGWWWLAISAFFGLGHSLGWSPQGDFRFDTVTFLVVTIFTLPYGWIAARSGSIWPSIIGHSLNNSTYVAFALLF